MKRFTNWLKKYFIPHTHNDFKPHFLRQESVFLILSVLIFIEILFLTQVFVVFDKTNFLASVLPGVLTNLTNEERAQNNVAPLTENALLTKAAQLKANDMAKNGYFAHTSPDGKTPWYWLDQVGYNYTMAGENLAINFFESKDVADAWMNSPTHRANIVKQGYTEIGIAVANGVYEGSNTVFVAQFFGTPVPTITKTTTPTTTTNTTTATPKPKTTTTKPQPKPTTAKPVAVNTTPKTTAPTTTRVTTPATNTPSEIKVLGEETTTVVNASEKNTILLQLKQFTNKILSSPREYVTYAYGAIALLVILALLLVVINKSEIKHPAIVARGITIVAVIIFLIFVNIKVLHLETKLPSEPLPASVILSH